MSRLMGNGMHLEAVACWVLYCMSHTVRAIDINGARDNLQALHLDLTLSSEDEMDEDVIAEAWSPSRKRSRALIEG